MLLSVPALGSASELADTIDKVRASIVAVGTARPIQRTNPENPPLRFLGTGFAIGDGSLVVSNLHVLPKEVDWKNDESLVVFTGRGEQATAIKVTVLAEDPEHDLVLLKLKGSSLPALTLAGDGMIREGEEVAFTGFPLGMVLGLYPVTHKAIVSAITPSVIPSQQAAKLTPEQVRRLRAPYEVYQLDAVAYPGNSGSPMYDSRTGVVLGVLNSVFVKGTKEAVLERPSGITYVIPVRYVNDLIKRGRR
ncbi:trypsin-like peptidase domain-containing protein [Pseudomaricurvus alkylphenolicus]|jgi:S1-C subfamily serine protease|nr:trypsin-like peptidase domain-containing protein [Pseudomaricurvus alkylphenolicus]